MWWGWMVGRFVMAQQRSSDYSGAAVGFTVFAAVMMITIGVFQVIAGIVALINDEFYVVGQEWVFQFDITRWGWVHLLLGVLIGLAGVALFSGAVWARTVGVILAVVSAVVNFAWLPWYPIWGIIMITVNVFVIWALTVHGRDVVES
jgi:tetrahydromethanopterin S-methyltransferase subunit F